MISIKDLIWNLGKKFNNEEKYLFEKPQKVAAKDFPELIHTYNNILKGLDKRNKQKWKIMGAWFHDFKKLKVDTNFKKNAEIFLKQLTDSTVKDVLSDLFIKKIEDGVRSILKNKGSGNNSEIKDLFDKIESEMIQEEKENYDSDLLVLQNWFMARLPQEYEKDYEDFVKRKKGEKQQDIAKNYQKLFDQFGKEALDREWTKIQTKTEEELEQEKQIKLQEQKENNEAKIKQLQEQKIEEIRKQNARGNILIKLKQLKAEMENQLSQLLLSKFDDVKKGNLESNDYLFEIYKKMIEDQQNEVDSLISQQDNNKKLEMEKFNNNSQKKTEKETIDSNLEQEEQFLFSKFLKNYFDGHISPTLKISREEIVLFRTEYSSILKRFAEFQKLLDQQLRSSNKEQLKEYLQKYPNLSNLKNFVEGFVFNFEKINHLLEKFQDEEKNIQENIKKQSEVLQQQSNEAEQKVIKKIKEQKDLIEKYAEEIFYNQQLEFLQNSFLEKDEDIKTLQQEFQKIPNIWQGQELKFQETIDTINKQKNNILEKIRELKINQNNKSTIFAQYPQLEIFNNEIRNLETLKNKEAILFTAKVKAYYEFQERNKIQLEKDKQEIEKLKSEVKPELKQFRKKFNNLAEIKKIEKQYKINLMKIKKSQDISAEQKIQGLAELKKYYEKQLDTEWEKWISDITKHPERIATLLKLNRIKLKEKSLEDNKKIWNKQEADLWSEIESIKKAKNKISEELESKKSTFIAEEQTKLENQEKEELKEINKLKKQQQEEWENDLKQRKIDFINKFIDYFPDQKSQLIQLKTLTDPNNFFNIIKNLIYHNQRLIDKNIKSKIFEENQDKHNLVLAAAEKCFSGVLPNYQTVLAKNIYFTLIFEELETLFLDYQNKITVHQKKIDQLEARYKVLADVREQEITNKNSKEIGRLRQQQEIRERNWINTQIKELKKEFSKILKNNPDFLENDISNEVLAGVIKIYFERKNQIEQEIAEQSLTYTLKKEEQEFVDQEMSNLTEKLDLEYHVLEQQLDEEKQQKLQEKLREALIEHNKKRKKSENLLNQGLADIHKRKITESVEVEKHLKKGVMLRPSLFQEFLQTFNSLKSEVSQSQESLVTEELHQEPLQLTDQDSEMPSVSPQQSLETQPVFL